MTLKGIASGNQGAAIISVPNGGLAQNATSLATGAAIAAQILVQSATGVTITNITVDGANNGINGCGLDPIGIYYQNSSGTISHDSILNEVLGAGLTGCQAGLGIFVQSALYASAGQQGGSKGACANKSSETIGSTVEKNEEGRAGGFSLCPRYFLGRYRPDPM